VGRSLSDAAATEEKLSIDDLERYRQVAEAVLVDREIIAYAVALTAATREPAQYGLADLAQLIEYGASPRGSIGLIHAGRVLALFRGRGHVSAEDVRDLTLDVLRHRIVLSYDALSEGVGADDLLRRVIEAVPRPQDDHIRTARRVA
jgi:MoxR-like ATPase